MTQLAEHPAPASSAPEPADKPDKKGSSEPKKEKRKRSLWRVLASLLIAFAIVLVVARLFLPYGLRWYVNRVIDKNPIYDGKIGAIEVHLWRGAYAIDDIRLIKTTGDVPVPLFAAKKIDLAVQWDALLHGRIVGRVVMEKPELNFVDDPDEAKTQTGGSGGGGGDAAWLGMLRDLFPFKINRTVLKDGSIHFRTFQSRQPVDVYLSRLDASIDNLTNIRGETTPLMATVKATALAMDQAKFQFEMKLDPFSYYPTFQMAVRLLGLDVTKLNLLTRQYGKFDFERGLFDLVVEMNAREGRLEGYVKPIFRNLVIFSGQDLKEDNVLEAFWEALVGVTTKILSNPPRDQFATMIPVTGDMTAPRTGVLTAVGNILRNAFIRAYLPRLQGVAGDVDGLQFGPGSLSDSISVGDVP